MGNAIRKLVDGGMRIAFVTHKHRRLALLVAAGFTALFAGVVSQVPDRYQATARLHVDTQSVLRPMMASLTYQPDIDQQVGMLARTLISGPNIERLIDLPELQLTEARDPERRVALISRLMKDINITPTGKGNIYDITYRGNSPEQARRLVEATLAMFVESSAAQKRRDAQGAGRFIEEQIRAHEAKLVEAEENLKQFRIRNFGVSGVSEQDYYTRVSAAAEQVEKLQAALHAATQSRDAFSRELASEDPQLPQGAAQAGLAGFDLARRIEAQRLALEELRNRYTELHPDVVIATRALAQLEADSLSPPARTGAGKVGSTGHAATSPIYQKLRISLAEAEAEVASLASQLATKESQLAQVRSLANRAPQVEAEHAQLNRDYDVVRKNYDSLVARRESASMGEQLDASARLTDFRVTEPPRVSERPSFPARAHLALAAAFAALVCGVAAAQLADLLAPTVDDMKSLRALTTRPALGAIGQFNGPAAARSQRRIGIGYGLALAVLLVAQAGWVGWLARGPLLH